MALEDSTANRAMTKVKVIISKGKIVLKKKDRYGNTHSLTITKSDNLTMDSFSPPDALDFKDKHEQ